MFPNHSFATTNIKIVPGFKTWLSSVQIRVLTVSNNQNDYAEKIMQILNNQGYRADFDDREEKIGKKNVKQCEKINWTPKDLNCRILL